MTKNIKVAVIGAGMMGKNHMKTYKSLNGVELVGVYDIFPEAAKAAAEAMKEQHLLAEGNDPAVTEYRFTALPPQAARQTARRMLGEDFTPRLLPLEKLTAFSTE